MSNQKVDGSYWLP